MAPPTPAPTTAAGVAPDPPGEEIEAANASEALMTRLSQGWSNDADLGAGASTAMGHKATPPEDHQARTGVQLPREEQACYEALE